jgi:3-oxoacyl-[acyl-carrier-protein] synthase II
VVVRAAAAADPKHRVVITGMGIASVFGNDVNTFYDWCCP